MITSLQLKYTENRSNNYAKQKPTQGLLKYPLLEMSSFLGSIAVKFSTYARGFCNSFRAARCLCATVFALDMAFSEVHFRFSNLSFIRYHAVNAARLG
jgi:hypothetical protein